MYLTGFADEAAQDLASQIKATKEIGWNAISARSIDGTSIHELSEKDFNKALKLLEKEEISIPEIGSLIGNRGKKITDDFVASQCRWGLGDRDDGRLCQK